MRMLEASLTQLAELEITTEKGARTACSVGVSRHRAIRGRVYVGFEEIEGSPA